MPSSSRQLTRRLLKVALKLRHERQQIRNAAKELKHRENWLNEREKELERREEELEKRQQRAIEAHSDSLAQDGLAGLGLSSDLPELKRLSIPATNPFLFALEKTKLNADIKRHRRLPGSHVQLKFLVPLTATPLQKAKDVDLYDTTVELAFDATKARRIAATLYARFHYLDDSILDRFIMPSRLHAKTGGKCTLMDTLKDDCDGYQTTIMTFYAQGVKQRVETMGGLEVWLAATTATRLEIFDRLFDSKPLDMAVAALGTAAKNVPLAEIISDRTEDHFKWQLFHRTVFQFACEHTFSPRTAINDEKRMDCLAKWKGMVRSERFEKMYVGLKKEVSADERAILRRKNRPLPFAAE